MICMKELGELEKRQADFAARNLRVFVVSDDDLATAQRTQRDFPHLIVVSDKDRAMARAMEVIHAGANPTTGGDTNAPTTFLIDGRNLEVRWLFRPESYAHRLTPDQLLEAVDRAPRKILSSI